MPRGDKSSYTGKQKRQAEHIEEGYEKRGVGKKEAGAAGLGNRQQGNGRRQEERVGPRQEGQSRLIAQGRPIGWTRIGAEIGRGPFALGAQGGNDPQAARRALNSFRMCASMFAHRVNGAFQSGRFTA